MNLFEGRVISRGTCEESSFLSKNMAKSAAFSRIKTQILTITSSIPVGRLCTYGSIGLHLDVMPRHVAYILTMLSPEEKDGIPWQRVVADGGVISAPKTTKAVEQIEYLAREGIEVNKAKKVIDFEAVFIAAADLNSGVEQQYRENGLESG
jgi:methylated-DNA-protein-cysteine methyltransferase related protein